MLGMGGVWGFVVCGWVFFLGGGKGRLGKKGGGRNQEYSLLPDVNDFSPLNEAVFLWLFCMAKSNFRCFCYFSQLVTSAFWNVVV